MEIPVINRISDLEFSLPNPSMFSSLFSLSGIEAIRFWKWGALVLALVASFGTIVNGLKVLIVKFRRVSQIASEPLFKLVDDDDIYSSDDDDTCSTSSSLEDEREDDDGDESESEPMDEDFRVSGSGRGIMGSQGQSRKSKLRQRFSWTDLASGRSVVKLWDNLGLGLNFDGDFDSDGDGDDDSVISVYDMNREQRLTSLCGGKSRVTAVTTSRSIVTAADEDVFGNVSLRMWDTRVRCRIPQILAEWGPQLGKKNVAVRYGGGVEKVYVRDDAGEDLTVVGDVRKLSSPLANLTESDVETWWDADAVIVPDGL